MAKWWTESWNPVTGCTPISEACRNCYAKRWAKDRLAGKAGYPAGDDCFKPTMHPDRLDQPFHWQKRRRVFVGNMGDIFHEDITDESLHEIFFPIYTLTDHVWMVLTKRVERMVKFLLDKPALGPNVWIGVTVESDKYLWRIEEMLKVRKVHKDVHFFLSVEPMLSGLSLRKWLEIDRLAGTKEWVRSGFKPELSWIQCGGETGPEPRPMDPKWAYDLLDECRAAGVAFFFKQNYGRKPIPVGLDVQEIPKDAEV